VFLDFGTACRTEGTGWPVSVPETAPCGLSAVSGNKSRWPACSLAVVAFPPRVLRAGGTAFRRPSRYYATIRLLSSHRHLVVGSSMTTALHAEAERSPWVSTQNFVPTPSPIRPPVRRIWASLPLASSPQGWTPLTALRFRSVRYCIIRLLPDAPSRVVRSCERPCLVDGGFPPSGPQEDLTATCLTSLFCVHAKHTKASLAALAAGAALTRPPHFTRRHLSKRRGISKTEEGRTP
jgi:hypothetical protein